MSRTYRKTYRGRKTDWLPDYYKIYQSIRKQYGALTYDEDEKIWRSVMNDHDFFLRTRKKFASRQSRKKNTRICRRMVNDPDLYDRVIFEKWNKIDFFFW